jgi:hypothetical protein
MIIYKLTSCGLHFEIYSNRFSKQQPINLLDCTQSRYYLFLDENQHECLKTDSPWYDQIQRHIGVCEVTWCHIMFYTLKSFICERFYFDKEFVDDLEQKCDRFFKKYMSNQFLSTHVDFHLEINNTCFD